MTLFPDTKGSTELKLWDTLAFSALIDGIYYKEKKKKKPRSVH